MNWVRTEKLFETRCDLQEGDEEHGKVSELSKCAEKCKGYTSFTYGYDTRPHKEQCDEERGCECICQKKKCEKTNRGNGGTNIYSFVDILGGMRL